jgi:hypothetical protein
VPEADEIAPKAPSEQAPVDKRKKKEPTARKRAPSRPYPTVTFEDALELALAIQEHAAGQRVKRLTLFDKMGKSPSSGPSRELITNSGRYGLTEGSYNADSLSLTEQGAIASSPEAAPREQARARLQLAIEGVPPFSSIYKGLVNSKIPSREVLRDRAGEVGIPDAAGRAECIDIFLANAKFVGVLKVLSGAERMVSPEHLLDELPGKAPVVSRATALTPTAGKAAEEAQAEGTVDYDHTAFFIATIGDEGTEHRKHSDMMLGSFVEKAVGELGLKVVRADKIAAPGMINGQVIAHVLRSKIVIADLSFHNPNVFYELAIRHMTGLPAVHIVRKEDKIPFDLQNFRTVTIDTSDKYDLIARMESHVSEIANHVRQALASGVEQSNPIRAFNPKLKVTFE